MKFIKSVISIQTIMISRLLCGFYYNISSNNLLNALVRAYCVILATIIVLNYYTIIIYADLPSLKVRFGLLGIQYTANVLISLFFSGENFFDFLKNITDISISQGLKLADEIPFSRLLLIFSLLGKLTGRIMHVLYSAPDPHNTISIMFFDIMLHLSNFTRIMMFELLWHQMAMLRKHLDQALSIARRFEDGEGAMKEKLRKCIITYKNLLNTTRQTDAPMKILIFSSIVGLFPKILGIIYYIISHRTILINYLAICEATVQIIISLSPALLAGMVNSEIDKMKLCVVKQLLVCRGETTRDAIQDAMVYFRQHPFKYTIWRLFTLDLTMILSVIGLLTTYTVAMIQFAHLYD